MSAVARQTTILPEPLVEADIDLRDFTFMPLEVVRLRDSGLATKASGDAFRAAVLLWCAAWHQVPASSLPDDDHELAKLAGYGRDVRGWKKVRSTALHGFTKCADGLLYHKVIAEKARESWKAKQAQRARTAAATEARMARIAARETERSASGRSGQDHGKANDEGRDDQRNVERNEERECPRDDHQVKGQGQGELRDRDIRSSLRSDAGGGGSICDRFFSVYPKHEAEDGVRRELDRLVGHGVPESDVIDGAKRYAATVAGKPPDKIANPVTWLRDGRWKDGTRVPPSKPLVDVGVRVDRDTPAGRAWAAYELARTGHPVKWILPSGPNGPGRHFPTEWPPTSQEDAA